MQENRIQLRKSTVPGHVPLLSSLLLGELGINLPDHILYVNVGDSIVALNGAANIVQDPGHRFVTDVEIDAWSALATKTSVGNVQVGTNIDVDAGGVISVKTASALNTGVLSAADWATFNGKQNALGYVPVNKAGDTMLGSLVLKGSPTVDNEASNKAYVDQGLGSKLSLSGGTLTGSLLLSADPTQSLGATTKQYVDNAVSLLSGEYGAPVQALTDLAAVNGAIDKQMRLVEDAGAIFRFDAQSSEAADGVVVISPTSGVGRWIKVQAATQNHNQLNGIQGGALNDYLHLTTAEKNSYDAHIIDMGLHLTVQQNALLDALNASSAELNFSIGVTSPIQAQLNSKQGTLGFTPVNIAGDTMTGLLVLSGDPSDALGAVTKQYADNLSLDGGTF